MTREELKDLLDEISSNAAGDLMGTFSSADEEKMFNTILAAFDALTAELAMAKLCQPSTKDGHPIYLQTWIWGQHDSGYLTPVWVNSISGGWIKTVQFLGDRFEGEGVRFYRHHPETKQTPEESNPMIKKRSRL